MNPGNPLDEYREACTFMRHYGNMRFVLFSVFLAVVAGLLLVLHSSQFPLTPRAVLLLKLVGLVLSIAFYVIDERANQLFFCYQRRAIELEKVLDYCQHMSRPRHPVFNMANATRLIFLCVALLWIGLLVWPS